MRRPLPGSDLAAVVRRFAGRKVAVIGDAVIDAYVYGQTDRISREAPVLIVRQEATEQKLGAAANAAANLAALGARPLAVAVAGDDELGDEMERLLEAAGIEPRVVRAPGTVTESKTRIMAGGMNTTRQQMLRVDRVREAPLSAAVLRRVLAQVRRAVEDAEAVVVSDYGGGVLAPEVVSEVLRCAREGARICVDSRYNLRAFRGPVVAKPNEPELAAATGLPVGTPEDTVRAAKALQRWLGASAVLVTRGRSGMALVEKGRSAELVPVHGQREAVDVTGAGDTVVATLTLALAAGASLSAAAHLANVAGALVVSKPGTATVDPSELLRELP